MARQWWTPSELLNAARLLEQAASNLQTSYPNSPRSPNPVLLPVVKNLIDGAQECIKAAQPTE